MSDDSMQEFKDEPSDRELRISELLAQYLRDRDEGEAGEEEDFLAANPEFADDLRMLLDMGRVIEDMAGPLVEEDSVYDQQVNEISVSNLAAGELEDDAPSATGVDTGTVVSTTARDPNQSGSLPGKESAEPEGYQFGEYELLEVIGQGGMGIVYKARQRNLDRIVAVKMIRVGSLALDDEISRFYSEAQKAGRAVHSNLTSVYEIGELDGRHYYAMQFVDGTDLAELLRQDKLSNNRIAEILRDISEGIHSAHTHGVLHRDLKPANILVRNSDGSALVTDFGLARQVTNPENLTRPGVTVGTPSYMSPEQASAKTDALCAASDVYSIGAILYEMLSGRPPFHAESAASTVMEVLNLDPTPPSQVQSKVSPELEAVCLKCLEKNPADRYQSAEELAEEFSRFLSGAPVLAELPNKLLQGLRWFRNVPAIGRITGNTMIRPKRAHRVVNHCLWIVPLLIVLGIFGWGMIQNMLVPAEVTLASGQRHHFYHEVGESLHRAVALKDARDLIVRTTAGSQENVNLVVDGSVHLAIAQWETIPQSEEISIVAPLFLDKVHFVVKQGSNIRSLEDLEGRNVSLGLPNSGMRLTSERILRVCDVDASTIGEKDRSFEDLLTLPQMEAAIVTTSSSNPVLHGLLADSRFQLIKFSLEQIEKLLQTGYRRDRLISRDFPDLVGPAGIPTISTMAFLITHVDSSDALVESTLHALYDEIDSESVVSKLGLIKRPLAREFSVRFHPSAAHFYSLEK